MHSKQSREPLLYIQQPNFAFPEADMQQVYRAKKAKQEQEKQVSNSIVEIENNTKTAAKQADPANQHTEDDPAGEQREEAKKSSSEQAVKEEESQVVREETEKKDLNPAAVQELIHEYHKKSQNEGKDSSPFTKNKQYAYSFKRVKGFKEMSIEERLNYLVHFPKLLPPVPCIFITNNSSVRGFLLNKTDDMIEIKQFNEKVLEIPIEQLTEVKMIGI